MEFLLKFIRLESSSGILLMIATVLALLIANSALYSDYHTFLMIPVSFGLGAFTIEKTMEHFINDGLMAIFFLLIGLEIKRELIEGELSSVRKAILPCTAAVGGVLFPALIYVYFNYGTDAMAGWAVPAATDIAFSLGILSLFGSRVPISLKVFLMAVAVIDDLIAVLIIAFFYTSDLSVSALGYAGLAVIMLVVMNLRNIQFTSLYVLVGLVLWACVLKSGVHATIAGVILGFLIPLKTSADTKKSLAKSMEHSLHPWIAYFIMPVFAFANAGVSFKGITADALLHPIPLGIALGLFIGKQVGIVSFTWIMTKLKLASYPRGVGLIEIYAVSCIAGIGFTMSLFIGGLAFDSHEQLIYTRIGVLTGSLVSAIFGYVVLSKALKRHEDSEVKQSGNDEDSNTVLLSRATSYTD